VREWNSRIAVALRDPDTWLPLLRTTFDRFGIPHVTTSPHGCPASVSVFLSGLISCALQNWSSRHACHTPRASGLGP